MKIVILSEFQNDALMQREGLEGKSRISRVFWVVSEMFTYMWLRYVTKHAKVGTNLEMYQNSIHLCQ